jgi:G6PDH family F420-dependent oxidoreductase
VENARLYSLPDSPPPVAVSSFGPESLEVAVAVGEALVTTEPDAAVVERYRRQGGTGPTVAAVKVCWGEDEHQARASAHRLWATECLPGQLNQELPTPAHFQQAAQLVTEDMVAEQISCGPDPERHVKAIAAYLEAGFDEIYVNQIGPQQGEFLKFFENELRPRLRVWA